MIAYIIRRLLQLVIVLFGVTLITFVDAQARPRRPGRRPGRQERHAGAHRVHPRAARPRPARSTCSTYRYVERLAHGDLGESYSPAARSRDMIRETAPVTIQLASPRCSSSSSASPWASTRPCASTRSGTPRSPPRRSSSGASRVRARLLHAMSLRPQAQLVTHRGRRRQRVLGIIPATWKSLQTLILPAVTLGLIEVAYISYMQRASMLEVIRSDYIRTARAKGLCERKVIWGTPSRTPSSRS